MKPMHFVVTGTVAAALAVTTALLSIWTGDDRWGDTAALFTIVALFGLVIGGVGIMATDEAQKYQRRGNNIK